MEYIKYIGIWVLVVIVIWLGGVYFADSVKDVEVITPAPNVKCAVVSRMFNTSIACWNEK
jgi:hypothetical protein